MRTLACALGIAAAAALGAGCLRATELACDVDRDCSGGTCEPNGRCSFTDLTCASGRRYGDGAGGLSGACVGEGSGNPDAGGDGAEVPIDGVAVDLIPHVRLEDETVGEVPIDVTVSAIINTTDLTANPPLLGASLVALPHDGGGPELAVLRASSFTIAANAAVVVVGARPLVVLANTVVISGDLELGASNESPGPGGFGSPMGPGAGSTGMQDNLADGGGGGGAASGSAGGPGGAGVPAAGGPAGAIDDDATIPVLHGGSPGGSPFATQGCAARRGGGGGGALQIYAATRLTITDTGGISAGGGGGMGGTLCTERSAGAGGGSGGAIYLQSPMLLNQGIVAANGGGGGGGAARSPRVDAGVDGAQDLGGSAGGGGVGQLGGAGGVGSMLDQPGGPGVSRGADGNGGGGGGGGGRIVLRDRGQLAIGTSSPTATPFAC